MSQVSGFKLNVEEYASQADWIEKLLRPLNNFAQSTVNAVNGGLVLSQNVVATYKRVQVKAPVLPWTSLTPQNSWSNYSGEPPFSVYTEWNGRVTIRGTLNVGTKTDGTTIATLPNSTYFPEYDTSFGIASDSASDKCQITISKTDGTIKVYDVGSSGNVFHFTGISWFAATPGSPKAYVGNDWPIKLATGFDLTVGGVLLMQATDVDTNETLSTHVENIDWVATARNEVTVKSVTGLTPKRTYDLTFLIVGV